MLATWNASPFLELINREEYKPIVEAMIEANGTPFLRSLYSYTKDYPDEKRIVAHRLMLDNTVEGRRCLKATHVSIRDQPAVDSKSIHSQYSNADTLYRGSLKHDITLISPATYQRKRRPGAILSGAEGPINEHFVCLLTVWMLVSTLAASNNTSSGHTNCATPRDRYIFFVIAFTTHIYVRRICS